MRIAWLVLFVAVPVRADDAPRFEVVNRVPSTFTVVNKVPAVLPNPTPTDGVIVGRVTDPTGRHELVETWNGTTWFQEWRAKGVSRTATPKGGSTTGGTMGTTARTRNATPSSTTLPRSSGAAYTLTPAGYAVPSGSIGGCLPFG